MKKILLIILATMAIGCTSKDFSKIKVGMKTSEVKQLVGEPDEQTQVFGMTMLMYKDGDEGHLITIVADTVAGYKGGKELEKAMTELSEGVQDIEVTIDSLQN